MQASAAALAAAGRVALVRARRPLRAALEITDTAAERLRVLLLRNPAAVAIRVGVKSRGCNGQSYTMNYANERGAREELVEAQGVRVLIEPGALLTIAGTTMDWREDELSAQFVFENPNAKAVCGCGESFTT